MSGSTKKKPSGKDVDLKKEHAITAVVMADSFDKRFRPITYDMPRCLLPLGNRPILGYTLEYLKNSGVQECIIFCSSHQKNIKQYLRDARWTGEDSTSSMNIVVTTNEDCRSFGDAMRDIDGHGLIRGDFILVSGDTVSNVDMRPILEAHKARAKEDKHAAMTLVYRQASPGHDCRTTQDEVVAATDGSNQRLLHYQRLGDEKKIAFPMEIFQSCSNVEVRYDLLDPCIAVCSQSIPPLFADNFDFQTLDSFIHGILTDDLVDSTLYLSVLTEGYAARVSSPHNYLSVSRDVLRRWLHPIVPEVNPEDDQYQCKLHRRNVYKCPDAQLLHGSQLERDVILDSCCFVGEDSFLSSTLVGKGCKIGQNVTIRDSIIMEAVKIGNNCKIEGAIVGSNAILEEGTVVQTKSIIGPGVQIPKGTTLPHETRLVRQPRQDGFSDDEEDAADASGQFGPLAHAFVDSDVDSDDDDDDGGAVDAAGRGDAHRLAALWGLTLAEKARLAEAAGGSDGDDDVVSTSSEESDFEGMDEVGGDLMEDEEAKNTVFHNEVLESLQRGVSQNLSPANLIVEINSSRHAYNETRTSVVQSVTKNLLHIAATSEADLEGAELYKAIRKVLLKFKDMLKNYCTSDSTEVDCLGAMEDFARQHGAFLPVAQKTIHQLYELEVVSEDAILAWFQDSKRADDDQAKEDFAKAIRKSVQPLIEWLQEDDDSDDDSEE